MKYEEKAGPENFARFTRLATDVLSVSNAVVNQKLAQVHEIVNEAVMQVNYITARF